MAKKVTHYFEVSEANNAKLMNAYGKIYGKNPGETDEDVFQRKVQDYMKKVLRKAQIRELVQGIVDKDL